MKRLDYWDQKDKADRMGVPPPPRHPHIGITPPNSFFCSYVRL